MYLVVKVCVIELNVVSSRFSHARESSMRSLQWNRYLAPWDAFPVVINICKRFYIFNKNTYESFFKIVFQRCYSVRTLNGHCENNVNSEYLYTKIENQSAADSVITDFVFTVLTFSVILYSAQGHSSHVNTCIKVLRSSLAMLETVSHTI